MKTKKDKIIKKWLIFEEKRRIKRRRTKVYSVLSLIAGVEIGKIEWFPAWRHYCFFPTMRFISVYSDRCLLEIYEFITKLNRNHTRKRKKKRN